MAGFKLVRIKPTNKRDVHVAFGVTVRKSDGWCRIPAGTADLLKDEPMNDMNPSASARVFDVMDEDEAREIEASENAKAEPAGTVSSPKEKVVAVPESDEPKRSARGR